VSAGGRGVGHQFARWWYKVIYLAAADGPRLFSLFFVSVKLAQGDGTAGKAGQSWTQEYITTGGDCQQLLCGSSWWKAVAEGYQWLQQTDSGLFSLSSLFFCPLQVTGCQEQDRAGYCHVQPSFTALV